VSMYLLKHLVRKFIYLFTGSLQWFGSGIQLDAVDPDPRMLNTVIPPKKEG
jgi:hypothetical protein